MILFPLKYWYFLARILITSPHHSIESNHISIQQLVKILNTHQVPYKAVNVLENPNIRVELSKHSNWPTIPQLFVNGELIGGCDIAMELHNSGQLHDVLNKVN